MAGFKTEGIILKRKNFGEADRILTVFTLHRGKLSVLAKGVRRITSRRGGNVELLNRVSMFLYPGKNFWILTEAESLNTYPNLKADLTLTTYSFHILELVDKLTAEDQENRSLYTKLVEVLKRLSLKPRQILIRAFEAKILSNLGFITFQRTGANVNHLRGGLAWHLKGASLKVGKLLEELQILSWDKIENMEINEKEALELERILRYYIEKVIEKPLKSRRFLKKL